ncbi:MFS transporter [Sphingomonas sp. ASY06-1R]|uniref:MFS transporter n=1 Tax=Sphingomonas sp. ASY06-1R TaxID=3445771 RepID=UPI003FA32B0B
MAVTRPISSRIYTIAALAFAYAILGIMMNSVGVVILQSIQHLGATKPMGSLLEACKDLSVVAASFLLATRVAAFGFRRTMILALLVMAAACLAASFVGTFVAMQLLFVATGLCFGVVKVATYSTIGLLARDRQDHASITGTIEGAFMIGVLAGMWIFAGFIAADRQGTAWLHVYWLIAGLCLLSALSWATLSLDESGAAGSHAQAGWREMLGLAVLPATVVALIALFLYVLIEQGVGSWLPTFNSEVLRLPAAMSVQMSTIFTASLAVGRLGSGVVLRKFHWLPVLLTCLAAIAILILISLPLAHGVVPRADIGWASAPVAAYLFPLLGIFLAPIYPTLCSVALSALRRPSHPAMVGLIVIFSALGGTLGSFITGMLFQHLPGAIAFYFLLVPLTLIALVLPAIRRRSQGVAAA